MAPAPQIRPQDLLQQALSELQLPFPRVRTAPPRGKNGTVGLAEWFWVDPAQTKPMTRRVAAGPVWAELTASPQQLTIAPGPGMSTVACPGAGVPYNGQVGPPAGACTYTYTRSSAGQPGGAYSVTATVTWGGTWRGSGGAGGALPAISRSTTFPVQIAEGQALN